MRRWLLALGLCLLCGSASPLGNRNLQTIPYAPIGSGVCPQGTVDPLDGCATAPAPLTAQWRQPNAFQSGGYFNTIAGTSANYMATICGVSGTALCRPPWNVVCVDYACGNYTAVASLADPATMSVPGCTYSISGTGGGLLTCTGSSFEGVLQHINFGPVTGAGAHGCTALNIAGHDPAVTTLLLDDLYVFNDTGLCSTGTGSNYWLQVPDFYSGGVTFSNVYADFNNSVWDTKMGGCAGTTACNPWIIDFLANTVTGKYVVVRNPAGNPLTGTHGLGSVQTFQYVWIENWTSRGPNGHTEAYDGSSGSGITPLANAVAGGLTFDHPVFLQGQNVSNFGTGPIWTASNYPFAITNGPKVLSGTFINSFVGGRPKAGVTFSGCWGGSFSGGVCGAPGASNHLYITSETGTLGYGADVDCTGGSFVTYKSVTPTGGAIEEYIVDGFSGTQYGPAFQISASAVTCTSKTVGPAIGGTDAVISTRAATPFGSPNFSGNYLDVTSFSGSPGSQTIWQIKQVDNNVSVPSGTITTSLGVSTLNTGGPSAQYGAYVNGVGVDGCSLGIQGCPRIASGSAGVYTLDTAVTPIGPIAMTVVPWNWCAVPAVVAGNVDMAALISDASLNKMSSVTAGNGCVAPAVFTPPTLTPSISSNFNPNVTSNFTSNSLSPNGGAAGALEFPTTPTNSAAFYFEAVVDPALAYGFNGEFLFSGMTMDGNTNPGQPAFLFNRLSNGQQGAWWWLNPGMNYASGGSATAGSGYVNGIYPVTAPNSGCIRAPSGVWRGLTNIFQQTDPGLGCPTGTLSLNAAAIAANVPNSGAQQTATSATCASGGAGILVTTSVPVSPGLSPGLQYTVNLTGTGGTSLFGATLTATSVTGSGPYTVVGTIAGTCPTGLAGTIMSGTGGAINFPTVSTTYPAPYKDGSTGIATHNGQHICGWIVENGADSTFPGSQAIEMVDNQGNSLTGSPALVPFLNQGTSTFQGSTDGSTAVVNVSSLGTPFPISSGATFDSSGFAHFSVTTNPQFVPGSEFTVSGITTTGGGSFNLTYVTKAISGTGPYLITANPLAGPAQALQASALTTSSSGTTGGALVSVILPGQVIAGLSTSAIVMPYGTNSTTGTGGIGTYALSGGVPALVSTSTMWAYSSFYYSEATPGVPVARTQGSIGDFIGTLGGGWGGSLGDFTTLWGPIPAQAGGAPSVSDLASICKKQTDIQTYAAAHSLTTHSRYRLNDLGVWGDSGDATITGYITNTIGNNATLNVVSTLFGSLGVTPSQPTAYVTGPSLPVASPVTIPLTASAGSTYLITPNTTAALGSAGSPFTFAVGAFKPAKPNAASTMKGYIDTGGGVSTLHVTSFDDGSTHSGFYSFRGSYNPATGVLSADGTIIGSIPAPFVVSGASITGQPLFVTQFTGGGPPFTYNTGLNYYPTITNDTTMWATTSSVVPGEYILNSAITTPVKVLGNSWSACGISGAYNGLLGCYTLSANVGAVGLPGAQVVFTGTTITDGGAIAPGPALTIDDNGPGTVFPVSFGTNTGTITLSGKYDVPTLGGTPSGIQVLVSNSANGPPLAGCTPCNWGALTGTISGGVWSGTLAGIPGGGPYFVSVRATNGVAYTTMSQSIRVGAVYATWGNGQAQSMFGAGAQGGKATSWFSGLYGTVGNGSAFDAYMTGPPISADFVPSQSFNNAGDRFGVGANGIPYGEPVLAFDQGITNAFGVPGSIFYAARDGTGMGLFTLGNVKQTQTVGSGTGSQTVWCSATKFCGNVDVGSPLTFNAASLTGVWFAGSASGTTLTVTTRYGGALEPGMVLGATGSPTVVRCLTGCTTPLSINGSTWLLSAATTATGTFASPLRADPPTSLIPFGGTTTPWPNLNIQSNGTSGVYLFAGFGQPLIKAGTFNVTVNGTVVCQDSATFAYNITGGNCTGPGVSGFVNYLTGDYQITFTTAPASSAAIIASWTNIISPEATSSGTTRPQNLDEMGDGTPQSGFVSSRFSKFPGGISGQIWASQGSDLNYMANISSPMNTGYEYGALGYSQMMSWLVGTKFPALMTGSSAATPFLTTDLFRLERPSTTFSDLRDNIIPGEWAKDFATNSTFSGTVSGSVLTLTTSAVGPMWEGEVLGCVTYNASTCPIGPLSGAYIIGLHAGSPAGWGANTSTYDLSMSPGNFTNQPIQNSVYYSGAGSPLFLGTLNDIQSYDGTHPGGGFAGGRRALSRWAAMIYEANAGGKDPQVDRVKADAVGCDAAALAAPCFDIGATYQASASGTISGSTITFTGGLAAHARPFVDGMVLSCAGCTAGRVITSVSAPPTQSTVSGAGQIGNTFTVVASGSLGVSTTETVTGGCSGTSGVGSNCIDIAISTNVVGLGSPAIDTCGSNTLNGTASGTSSNPSPIPNGKCQGGQIGDLVRGFRIGTVPQANGDGNSGPVVGLFFDDGMDPAGGGLFNQSAAFSCHIVAAKVVQCVKAPAYTAGVFSAVGQWASGSTYMSYGDAIVVSSRVGTLLGYVGGQSFPFTAGSGGANGTTQPAVTCSGGGTLPKFDVTVAGGAIVNVVPSAVSGARGLNLTSTCSVALPSGSSGVIPTITLAPTEGVGGIGAYSTDHNTMGAAFLYDNSCSGPLNQFFNNGMGGCFEPGLPVRPFGQFQGAGVSG